jgi:hypothetical protein
MPGCQTVSKPPAMAASLRKFYWVQALMLGLMLCTPIFCTSFSLWPGQHTCTSKSFEFNWNYSHDMSCTICSTLSATIFRTLVSCTLKMEAAGAYEMLVTIYESTLHHIPEDLKCQQHCCKFVQSWNVTNTAVSSSNLEKLYLQLLNACNAKISELHG